jgi:hypothetical protein
LAGFFAGLALGFSGSDSTLGAAGLAFGLAAFLAGLEAAGFGAGVTGSGLGATGSGVSAFGLGAVVFACLFFVFLTGGGAATALCISSDGASPSMFDSSVLALALGSSAAPVLSVKAITP